MKALSYLENEKQMVAYGKMMPSKIVLGNDTYKTHYGFLQSNKICTGSLINFYSQPFKPELITELFEGWKILFGSVTCKSNIISTEPNRNGYIRFSNYLGKGETKVTYFPPPRTLDDFINDTGRAGIELEWRIKC